jgi:hypothetical protein
MTVGLAVQDDLLGTLEDALVVVRGREVQVDAITSRDPPAVDLEIQTAVRAFCVVGVTYRRYSWKEESSRPGSAARRRRCSGCASRWWRVPAKRPVTFRRRR